MGEETINGTIPIKSWVYTHIYPTEMGKCVFSFHSNRKSLFLSKGFKPPSSQTIGLVCRRTLIPKEETLKMLSSDTDSWGLYRSN